MTSGKKNGTSSCSKKKTIKKSLHSGNQTILEDITYVLGSVSRHGVDGIKKVIHQDTSEKIGRNLGTLRRDVENGWKDPKDLLKTPISNSSCGNIIGSTTRHGANALIKAYKSSASYVGKGYKKGRVETLIAIWKVENPGATKADKETAVKQIRVLFRS